MKVLLEHALPDKIDYVRFLVDAGVATFYFSFDGKKLMWFGRIEKERTIGRSLNDAEYCRYRLDHPVEEVVNDDGEHVVLITQNGAREHWLKPRWTLKLRERIRRSNHPEASE